MFLPLANTIARTRSHLGSAMRNMYTIMATALSPVAAAMVRAQSDLMIVCRHILTCTAYQISAVYQFFHIPEIKTLNDYVLHCFCNGYRGIFHGTSIQ